MEKHIFESNKKARREYEFLDTFEAGLELLGSEVKAIRAGGISLRESYISIKRGEAYLDGAHIKPYEYAGQAPDPYRQRKLLLHKREIEKLSQQIQAKGLTLVPVDCYANKDGRLKLTVALAKGRKLHDKRSVEKDKQIARSLDRVLKRG